MAESLRTFLEDVRREAPEKLVHVGRVVNPATYDVTAILKHLGALKNCPSLSLIAP